VTISVQRYADCSIRVFPDVRDVSIRNYASYVHVLLGTSPQPSLTEDNELRVDSVWCVKSGRSAGKHNGIALGP